MKAKTLTILLLSISALMYSQNIHEIWNVDGLNTYVLIGGENMDDDPAKELVFVEHLVGQYNPRIVIFDGVTGQVDYDTGPGIQNNYNVAGFNWTTQTGSDINTGRNALYDLDGDGIFELVYNLDGLTIEAVGFDGSNIDILWSVNDLDTYVLIGAKQMDTDPALELVFVNHVIGGQNYNPRIVIFDGANGAVDYDTGPGLQDHYNVAGFNWTTTLGSDINTGMDALHDLDNDGMFELVYNLNGQLNEAVGYDGNDIGILWSVDALGTFVLIGAEQMDNDAAKEIVFLNHLIGAVNYNPRFVIFDGANGSVDYDTGPGLANHYNLAGFNWTTTDGSNYNAGFKALHDVDGDGLFELAYNISGQTNEVLGFDGADLGVIWSVDGLGTAVLIGSGQMDEDPPLELVFLQHVTGVVNFNPRIVIFDGLSGLVEYDTGPGQQDHYNVAGFNWTTSSGSNINTGFKALYDVRWFWS